MDVVPVLGLDGFVSNKDRVMIKLYEYFMSSEYSQSNIFYGTIASMKYIVAEAKDDSEIIKMTKEALENMYVSYFKTVVVDVVALEQPAKTVFGVTITCLDDNNITHNLNQNIFISDNNIITYYAQQEALAK